MLFNLIQKKDLNKKENLPYLTCKRKGHSSTLTIFTEIIFEYGRPKECLPKAAWRCPALRLFKKCKIVFFRILFNS